MPETEQHNRFSNPIDPQGEALDRHHLLYNRKKWMGQPQERLRGLKYLIVRVPTESIHKLIHRKIHSGIPLPPRESCEAAYQMLVAAKEQGKLDFTQDTPSVRLQRLIDLWSEYPGMVKCVELLRYEQELFDEYFAAETPEEIRGLFRQPPPRSVRIALALPDTGPLVRMAAV